MRNVILVVLTFGTANLFAQNSVSNTKWKGHIEIPQALDIILEFKNDSLIATSVEGREMGVMSFSQTKDTLKIRKLHGQSPCNNTTVGIYLLNFTDNGDTLILYPIADPCKARATAISPVAYSRVKE